MTAEVATAGEAYRRAGVDIDAQDRALSTVKELVRSTVVPGVIAMVGAFTGMALGQSVRSRMDAATFRRWFLVAMLLLGIYLASVAIDKMLV